MRGLKPSYPIELTTAKVKDLRRLVRAHMTGQAKDDKLLDKNLVTRRLVMAQHMRSVQPIPVEVQQLAEIHSLGVPTASYSKRTFNFLLDLISVLLCSLLAIPFFIPSLILSAPPLILLAVVAGWLILMYIVQYKRRNQQVHYTGGLDYCIRRWQGYKDIPYQQVHIYTEGLVYLWPRTAEALRWEQIKTVWYEETVWFAEDTKDWDYLRIRKTDGTELEVRVSVLRGSSEIYRTIEREFVRIRLPGMIEQYEAGHSLAFGALSVNKLGLTYQGETLAWSQVQSIDVGDQRVEIKKEGQKWGNWFASRVPNQSLLRELVTHLRSSQ